jgi:hypothetical protein
MMGPPSGRRVRLWRNGGNAMPFTLKKLRVHGGVTEELKAEPRELVPDLVTTSTTAPELQPSRPYMLVCTLNSRMADGGPQRRVG